MLVGDSVWNGDPTRQAVQRVVVLHTKPAMMGFVQIRMWPEQA